MSCVFLVQCHHGICSGIVNRSLPNIRIDRHLIPNCSFVVVQIADDIRNVYAKKLPTKFQQKEIVDNFCMGCQYDRLEGQEGCRLFATKMNFEKQPTGGRTCG